MNLSENHGYFKIEDNRKDLKMFNPLRKLDLESYQDVIHPEVVDRFKELNTPANGNGNGRSVLKNLREVRQALLSIPIHNQEIREMKRKEMDYVLNNKRDRRKDFQITVENKTSGKTYTQEVSAARPFENKQELKQFLKDEAHSFVRRIGPVKDIKDLDVKVRPLESKELQPAREMGKEGISR